ncbi:MAG: LysR family transcriptional regulator [Myxococcota bacterium]
MSMVHDETALHRLDMNLLVAFDVLATERSVTRAAERMGVTQSAMSHTLRRLRGLFEDPLLVRGRGGMALTPRAEALRVPLRAGLSSVARALTSPPRFEPSTTQRTFRLASLDIFDMLALPRMLRRLEHEAPGVDLAVVPRPSRLSDALETGDLDIAIVPVLLDDEPFARALQPEPELRQRILLRDTLRCFVRPEHPVAGKRRLSPRRYAELAHVLVSPTGEGPGVVDRFLAPQGLQRRIALRVPQFAAALSVVADGDLVLTAPRSLADCALASAMVNLPVPIAVPKHAVTMVWHPRFHEDPAHRWFRQQMVEVTRAMAA